MSTLALCIPAYNASWCLPALFKSIKDQAISFDEVLLFDDCSTDNTKADAKAFGASVIEGKTNRGCSFGKNQLAQSAKSDWLFFLDSDDELYPSFSDVVRRTINENNEADIILLGYHYADASTGVIINQPAYDYHELKKDAVDFVIKNKIVNSSVIKRDAFLKIGGFDLDPEILYVEDRAYSFKCAFAQLKFEVIDQPVFKINFFPGSMSSNRPELWLEASINLWKKVYEKTGNRYALSLSSQLFENGIWAARYSKWAIVKKSLSLVRQIAPSAKPSSSKFFQFLFSIWPFGAYWIREMILRLKR